MGNPESAIDRHRARREIVQGLLRAVEAGGQILDLIQSSPDRAAAKANLMNHPWGFTEMVALHILDMPYGRTTERGKADLARELTELDQAIETAS